MPNYRNSFEDYSGTTIVVDWADELWTNHINKHPEIRDYAFASRLIAEALLHPSLVVSGEKPGDKENIVCYYKQNKRYENEIHYTKVVVGCNSKPFYVKTVFQRWALFDIAVQEKKYDFKEVYRDQKTYL